MTTHVSRERREAVAAAISQALPPYMQARGVLDPTGTPPHWGPEGAGVQALVDAALEAALPDKTAFAVALDRYGMAYVRVAGLNESADIDHVMGATENLKRRGHELFALVFGDDAQAGEVTG